MLARARSVQIEGGSSCCVTGSLETEADHCWGGGGGAGGGCYLLTAILGMSHVSEVSFIQVKSE